MMLRNGVVTGGTKLVTSYKGEKMTITDAMVEAAAIQRWAIDDDISLSEAERLISAGKPPAIHDGDCTKQSHTCFVCFRETQLNETRKILRAALQKGTADVVAQLEQERDKLKLDLHITDMTIKNLRAALAESQEHLAKALSPAQDDRLVEKLAW